MQQSNKPYDLEERTFLFAQRVRAFVRTLPRSISNFEDIKQVVRSSGSVGANYIEANESLVVSLLSEDLRLKPVERRGERDARFPLSAGFPNEPAGRS